MDDHFDIGRVFETGKFDITRLTCMSQLIYGKCSKFQTLSNKMIVIRTGIHKIFVGGQWKSA